MEKMNRIEESEYLAIFFGGSISVTALRAVEYARSRPYYELEVIHETMVV